MPDRDESAERSAMIKRTMRRLDRNSRGWLQQSSTAAGVLVESGRYRNYSAEARTGRLQVTSHVMLAYTDRDAYARTWRNGSSYRSAMSPEPVLPVSGRRAELSVHLLTRTALPRLQGPTHNYRRFLEPYKAHGAALPFSPSGAPSVAGAAASAAPAGAGWRRRAGAALKGGAVASHASATPRTPSPPRDAQRQRRRTSRLAGPEARPARARRRSMLPSIGNEGEEEEAPAAPPTGAARRRSQFHGVVNPSIQAEESLSEYHHRIHARTALTERPDLQRAWLKQVAHALFVAKLWRASPLRRIFRARQAYFQAQQAQLSREHAALTLQRALRRRLREKHVGRAALALAGSSAFLRGLERWRRRRATDCVLWFLDIRHRLVTARKARRRRNGSYLNPRHYLQYYLLRVRRCQRIVKTWLVCRRARIAAAERLWLRVEARLLVSMRAKSFRQSRDAVLRADKAAKQVSERGAPPDDPTGRWLVARAKAIALIADIDSLAGALEEQRRLERYRPHAFVDVDRLPRYQKALSARERHVLRRVEGADVGRRIAIGHALSARGRRADDAFVVPQRPLRGEPARPVTALREKTPVVATGVLGRPQATSIVPAARRRAVITETLLRRRRAHFERCAEEPDDQEPDDQQGEALLALARRAQRVLLSTEKDWDEDAVRLARLQQVARRANRAVTRDQVEGVRTKLRAFNCWTDRRIAPTWERAIVQAVRAAIRDARRREEQQRVGTAVSACLPSFPAYVAPPAFESESAR